LKITFRSQGCAEPLVRWQRIVLRLGDF
jgi:hypothetical protein